VYLKGVDENFLQYSLLLILRDSIDALQLIPIAYWRFLVKGASPWRRIPAAISNFGKA